MNPYDPEKEPVIRASYRCKNVKGRVEFYLKDPSTNAVYKDFLPNNIAPGIMLNGNIRWPLAFTPFEVEFSQLVSRENILSPGEQK